MKNLSMFCLDMEENSSKRSEPIDKECEIDWRNVFNCRRIRKILEC